MPHRHRRSDKPGHLTASVAAPRAREMKLAGWGRYPVVETQVYRPEKIAELAAVVAANTARLIPAAQDVPTATPP